MGSHGQIFSPVIVIVREQGGKTYKLLVMHQDHLFICVNVELDDITFTITVQQLITCKVGDTEKERLCFQEVFDELFH